MAFQRFDKSRFGDRTDYTKPKSSRNHKRQGDLNKEDKYDVIPDPEYSSRTVAKRSRRKQLLERWPTEAYQGTTEHSGARYTLGYLSRSSGNRRELCDAGEFCFRTILPRLTEHGFYKGNEQQEHAMDGKTHHDGHQEAGLTVHIGKCTSTTGFPLLLF